MCLLEKPVPSLRTKKNVFTREEIMSNLKLVPLPRTKILWKTSQLLEEQNIQRKKLTPFTKINCLLQNKIKEYASSPENLVKDLELSQYKYTPDALSTHKGIYSIYISISCLPKKYECKIIGDYHDVSNSNNKK